MIMTTIRKIIYLSAISVMLLALPITASASALTKGEPPIIDEPEPSTCPFAGCPEDEPPLPYRLSSFSPGAMKLDTDLDVVEPPICIPTIPTRTPPPCGPTHPEVPDMPDLGPQE